MVELGQIDAFESIDQAVVCQLRHVHRSRSNEIRYYDIVINAARQWRSAFGESETRGSLPEDSATPNATGEMDVPVAPKRPFSLDRTTAGEAFVQRVATTRGSMLACDLSDRSRESTPWKR
jgi:hypothetical protein